MKVLLIGEYSSLHYNLHLGLKELGVDVTLASSGDYWKNIPREVDLKQPEKLKKLSFPLKLIKALPKLTGYDIVQVIAPNFLMSRPIASSLYFDILKKLNNRIFMCAAGMEYHYVKYALTGQLKYSVFYNKAIQDDPYISNLKELIHNDSFKSLGIKVPNGCDGIIAISNGYHIAYKEAFPEKTHYIPLAIDTRKFKYVSTIKNNPAKINFFLGLMKDRMALKGTDRIQQVLAALKSRYPNDVNLTIVNSVPYTEYINLVNNSHVLCDQLYAYGIGMNGLIAQAKGLIVGGGADEEMYKALGETKNRPIIDLNTSDKDMLQRLEVLLDKKNSLEEWSINSRKFVIDNHDSVKVAKQYLDVWLR
jgi:glycosyltransferase involved in cell wall biosynthesis